jgi:carbamoyl-phosphate synthase large subunit
MQKVPYSTTVAGSYSTAQAIKALKSGNFDVRPLQDYFVA